MSPLDTALIILVSIWSAIFLILGIALVVILRQVKIALDRINHILQSAENFTEGVGGPIKAAAATLMGLISRHSSSNGYTKRSSGPK